MAKNAFKNQLFKVRPTPGTSKSNGKTRVRKQRMDRGNEFHDEIPSTSQHGGCAVRKGVGSKVDREGGKKKSAFRLKLTTSERGRRIK